MYLKVGIVFASLIQLVHAGWPNPSVVPLAWVGFGDTITCSTGENTNDGIIYRYSRGPQRRKYADTVALESWDSKWKDNIVAISCASVPEGEVMTLNVNNPPVIPPSSLREGQTFKCAGDAELYRYKQGGRLQYWGTAVNSWDAEWTKVLVQTDCSNIPNKGRLLYNPAGLTDGQIFMCDLFTLNLPFGRKFFRYNKGKRHSLPSPPIAFSWSYSYIKVEFDTPRYECSLVPEGEPLSWNYYPGQTVKCADNTNDLYQFDPASSTRRRYINENVASK